MIARIVAVAWFALAVAAAVALVAGLGRERARGDALAAFDAATFVTDEEERARLALRARRLLEDEIARGAPDAGAIASAWAVARQGPDGGVTAPVLARLVDARIARELAGVAPSERDLRRLWSVLVLLDDRATIAAARVRLQAAAGVRDGAVAELVEAARALRSATGRPEGDALLRSLAAAWERLREAGTGRARFTWIARESEPVAGAIERAAEAAYAHFDALLVPYLERGGPEAPLAGVRAVNREDPARGGRLRAAWAAIGALGQQERCDRRTFALYAAASRRDELPVAGLAWCVAVAVLLFGGLALAFQRLARGQRAIDPGAETMENVEPIEVDTDAVTVQRSSPSSVEETRVE